MTHFPIALAACAVACDVTALLFRRREWAAAARQAGAIAVVGAAAGSIPVVVSGLVLARGEVWGAGDLRWHHLFAWPAFGLLIAAGSWRILTWRTLRAANHAGYVVVAALTALALGGAGYWGGELLQRFP